MERVEIAYPSVASLLIEMRCNGHKLGTGTGFVMDSAKGPMLITNWHNVAGRNPETNAPLMEGGITPDELAIVHNRLNKPGEWVMRAEPLFDGPRHRWHEHPIPSPRRDLVALPLTQLADVQLLPHASTTATSGGAMIKCGPADVVSVVGFPFGMQAGGSFAVWATGFVASEPVVDFNNLPIFLIDCRSRPGQSGSAVIAYRSGGSVALEGGRSAMFAGPVWRFLGIYSGRINEKSDLGIVWKASAIMELLNSL